MMKKEALNRLKESYPRGTRVDQISMDDPYTSLLPGDQGTVTDIDDTGTIFRPGTGIPPLALFMA
jgi:hypothetical protein